MIYQHHHDNNDNDNQCHLVVNGHDYITNCLLHHQNAIEDVVAMIDDDERLNQRAEIVKHINTED